MDIIGWQEIAVRLSFAMVLGSATAIAKRWYQTKQFIQYNTRMALGAAIFSILASLTSETQFSAQLVLSISIICVSVGLQKQVYSQSINIDTVTRLWCAGAVGSMVGLGFFVPAYIAILIIILTNLLFSAPETDFIPYIEQKSNNDSKPKTELDQTAKPTVSQETYYQCRIKCLAVDEAEALASLVQLAKEQNLTPTGIRSKNLVSNNSSSEIEIRLDFVSNSNNSLLQLQQILMNLKSKLEVSSASWLNLSSELSNKNNEVSPENKKSN